MVALLVGQAFGQILEPVQIPVPIIEQSSDADAGAKMGR